MCVFSKQILVLVEILAILNFLPVQKLIFGHFWNGKKMEFGQKFFFREIDLFDFTSFFGPDFF